MMKHYKLINFRSRLFHHLSLATLSVHVRVMLRDFPWMSQARERHFASERNDEEIKSGWSTSIKRIMQTIINNSHCHRFIQSARTRQVSVRLRTVVNLFDRLPMPATMAKASRYAYKRQKTIIGEIITIFNESEKKCGWVRAATGMRTRETKGMVKAFCAKTYGKKHKYFLSITLHKNTLHDREEEKAASKKLKLSSLATKGEDYKIIQLRSRPIKAVRN